MPPGAGTVIRKQVVEFYLDQIAHDPIRQGLDPVGDQLSRAGDTDMALCAWDLQMAKGYFPSLKLTHLIPAKRMEPDYLARLFEGTAYCDTLLQAHAPHGSARGSIIALAARRALPEVEIVHAAPEPAAVGN